MHRAGWFGRGAGGAALTALLLTTALPAAVQHNSTPAAPEKKSDSKPAAKKDPPSAAPLCQATNMTVELPREFLQLVALNNSFIARVNSVGVLAFQNFFPQAIQEIAIVAEFQDASGKLIYPEVFAATATQTTTPTWFATYLPSQYEIQQWKQPIAPRATFTLGATSGITTAACPAQINVTLIHLQFADGTEMNYSTPGWQLPAQPEQIPGDLEFFAAETALPETFVVKVHVPAPLGPIIPPPQVELVSGKNTPLFEHIRDQMEEWRFWFAMRNGMSVDGDQMLLIRVHSQKEHPGPQMFAVARSEVPQPLAIIDLVPRTVPGKWAVYYGGADLSGNAVPQMQ